MNETFGLLSRLNPIYIRMG